MIQDFLSGKGGGDPGPMARIQDPHMGPIHTYVYIHTYIFRFNLQFAPPPTPPSPGCFQSRTIRSYVVLVRRKRLFEPFFSLSLSPILVYFFFLSIAW